MTVADMLGLKLVNVSAFSTHESLRIASCLCLKSVLILVCSPQNSSMDESLVNVFKCDYFSRMNLGNGLYVQ